MHYISGIFPAILLLMYEFFRGKVAEIRWGINNYSDHIIGLQVRVLICPELVRIRLLRNGLQQFNGIEGSVGGRWLLYSVVVDAGKVI